MSSRWGVGRSGVSGVWGQEPPVSLAMRRASCPSIRKRDPRAKDHLLLGLDTSNTARNSVSGERDTHRVRARRSQPTHTRRFPTATTTRTRRTRASLTARRTTPPASSRLQRSIRAPEARIVKPRDLGSPAACFCRTAWLTSSRPRSARLRHFLSAR